MNKQSMVYTVIFTFIVSFVFVTVLAFSNEVTRERVQLNNELALNRAVLNAIGIEYSSKDDILAKFDTVDYDKQRSLYTARVDSEQVYAKRFQGSGLWGPIEGIIAVTDDFDRISGLEIISHNETPGLGGRIEESVYRSQFRGLHIPDDLQFTLNKAGDSAKDSGQVDAITGATRTSEAMTGIINTQIQRLSETLGGQS